MTILGKPLNRVPVVFVKECGYIPSVLCNAERYIDKCIETKELFQVQGCQMKVTSLLFQLSSPKGFSKLGNVDVHDVIEAVKTFLVAMPEPLLSDDVCNKLIEASQTDNNLGTILVELRYANPSHFAILHFMMRLLAKVADANNKNGMDIRKLATIFVLDILKPLKIDDNSDVPLSFPTDRMKRLPYLIMVIEHLMEHLVLFKVRPGSPSLSNARQAKHISRCHSSQGTKPPSDIVHVQTERPASAPNVRQIGSVHELELDLTPFNLPGQKLYEKMTSIKSIDIKERVDFSEHQAAVNESWLQDSESRGFDYRVQDAHGDDIVNGNVCKSNANSSRISDNTPSAVKNNDANSKRANSLPRVFKTFNGGGSKNSVNEHRSTGSKAAGCFSPSAGGTSRSARRDSRVHSFRSPTVGQAQKGPNNGRVCPGGIAKFAKVDLVPEVVSSVKSNRYALGASSKTPSGSQNSSDGSSGCSNGLKGMSSSSGMTNSEITELVRDIVDLAKKSSLIGPTSQQVDTEDKVETRELKKLSIQEQKAPVKTNLHRFSPNLRLRKPSACNHKEVKPISASKQRSQSNPKNSGSNSRSSVNSQTKKRISDHSPSLKGNFEKNSACKNKTGKRSTLDSKRWMGTQPSIKGNVISELKSGSLDSPSTQPKKIKRGKKKNLVSMLQSASDMVDFNTFQPGEEIGPWLQNWSHSDTNMDISVLNNTIQQPRILAISPITKSKSDVCPQKNRDFSPLQKRNGSAMSHSHSKSTPWRPDRLSPSGKSSHHSFYSVSESPSKQSVMYLKDTIIPTSRKTPSVMSRNIQSTSETHQRSLPTKTSSRLIRTSPSPVHHNNERGRQRRIIEKIEQSKTTHSIEIIEQPKRYVHGHSSCTPPRKRINLKQKLTQLETNSHVVVSTTSPEIGSTVMSEQNIPHHQHAEEMKLAKRPKKIKIKTEKLNCTNLGLLNGESISQLREASPSETSCAPSMVTDVRGSGDTTDRMLPSPYGHIRYNEETSEINKNPGNIGLSLEGSSSLSNIHELQTSSYQSFEIQHPAAMSLLGKPRNVCRSLQLYGYESPKRMLREDLKHVRCDTNKRRSSFIWCHFKSRSLQKTIDIVLIITFVATACFVVFELLRTKHVE